MVETLYSLVIKKKNISMEHHHFYAENSQEMTIFNGYVKLTGGKYWDKLSSDW